MAKRLQVNFHNPGPTLIPEEGQPVPCARGVGWVNHDTLQTLDMLPILRTDAKGRPLPEASQEKRNQGTEARREVPKL
jgi:hypothetical protein